MMLGIPANSSMAVPIGRRKAGRTKLGEKDGDSDAQRHRNRHRNDGGDDGSINRRKRAKFLGDRIPNLSRKKAQAERLKRRDRALDQRPNHSAEDQQDDDRCALGKPAKKIVAQGKALCRALARLSFGSSQRRSAASQSQSLLRSSADSRGGLLARRAGREHRENRGDHDRPYGEGHGVYTGLPSGPLISAQVFSICAITASGNGT